jgi:hypothetical protein
MVVTDSELTGSLLFPVPVSVEIEPIVIPWGPAGPGGPASPRAPAGPAARTTFIDGSYAGGDREVPSGSTFRPRFCVSGFARRART